MSDEAYEKLELPICVPIIVYICSMYVCRGYTHLMDYSFNLMVMCFVCDEEMFQGTQRFANEKLRRFFDLFGSEVPKHTQN